MGPYGHHYPNDIKQSQYLVLFFIPHSCGASWKVLGEEVNASPLRSTEFGHQFSSDPIFCKTLETSKKKKKKKKIYKQPKSSHLDFSISPTLPYRKKLPGKTLGEVSNVHGGRDYLLKSHRECYDSNLFRQRHQSLLHSLLSLK